jgi:hypothetical protein
MSVFDYASAMGTDLAQQWAAQGYQLEGLPELALTVMDSYDPVHNLPLESVVRDVATFEGDLPTQRASGRNFGHPPLTLWNDPDGHFFIEMYLWSSTDMTIHSHPFTGAFAVLAGECVNEVFEFQRDGGSADLQLGMLEQSASETLVPGDARAITNGSSFIHRNLHMSRPTATFIIRTLGDGSNGLIYDEAGIALDPSLTPIQYKQLQFLEGLLRLPDLSVGRSYLQRIMKGDPSVSMSYQSIDLLLRKTQDPGAAEGLFKHFHGLPDPDQQRLRNVLEGHLK